MIVPIAIQTIRPCLPKARNISTIKIKVTKKLAAPNISLNIEILLNFDNAGV